MAIASRADDLKGDMAQAPLVLGISGRMRSGKSELAQALGRRLNAPVASFGEFCEDIAELGWGIAEREFKQAIGNALVKYPAPFTSRVISSAEGYLPGSSLVVEGIRHVDVYQELKHIVAPTEVRLVFLETPEDVMRIRMRPEVDSEDEISKLESDPTELSVKDVAPFADLTLDGSKSVDELCEETLIRLDLGSRVREGGEMQYDWEAFHRLLDLRASGRADSAQLEELERLEARARIEDERFASSYRDQFAATVQHHDEIIRSIRSLSEALERLSQKI